MPKYILIAGVNGAGKSTLYHSLGDIQNIPRVNADEILRSFGNWRNSYDAIKAGKIAVRQIKDNFNAGITFSQETTLCGKSILRNISRARKSGYAVEIHYVGINSVEIAKERVHQRVMNGGHGVSDEDIERRYTESLLNMRKVLSECNRVYFYDNTVQFCRIAIYQDGTVVIQSPVLPEWYKNSFEDKK